MPPLWGDVHPYRSLTDQIRRSSRSVSGNLAEAWGKRRYPKSFVNKLTDSEGEARKTQNWLDYAFACKYIKEKEQKQLFDKYDHIIGMLINMINNPNNNGHCKYYAPSRPITPSPSRPVTSSPGLPVALSLSHPVVNKNFQYQ